jgi:hypothetical protein
VVARRDDPLQGLGKLGSGLGLGLGRDGHIV